jgi:hypothetical protein
MLEKLERNNQTKTAIHVFVDNARYHHAKILQPWLDSPERRVKCKRRPRPIDFRLSACGAVKFWGI